jgi:hypothetical protein
LISPKFCTLLDSQIIKKIISFGNKRAVMNQYSRLTRRKSRRGGMINDRYDSVCTTDPKLEAPRTTTRTTTTKIFSWKKWEDNDPGRR